MPTNTNESQCYLMQLQIDSFLDGELTPGQQETFMSHVHGCSECAQEYRFARTMQDALIDMPLLDCHDAVLEPAHEIARGSLPTSEEAKDSPLKGFFDWLVSAPLAVRVAAPAFAVALLAVALLPLTPTSEPTQPQLASQPQNSVVTTPVDFEEYGPEDIARALLELNTAIDYLNKVSQRTESMIGGRFLVSPLRDRINASFERAVLDPEDPLENDPI